MKRFTSFLLVLALLLGGEAFAASEGAGFIPATGENSADPFASAEPAASAAPEASPTAAQPVSYVSTAVDPASVTYPIVCEPEEYIVRAGLYYGSTALASANLQNFDGSGYMFGWYDKDGAFTAVGYTAQERITTFSDRNMYVKDSTYYDSIAPSGATSIGAYHVQTPDSYPTYQEALAAAGAYASAFPAYINGEWRVRVGSYRSSGAAEEAAASLGVPNGTVVGASNTCYTVAVTPTGTIIFEFDNGGDRFGIRPIGSEEPVTWHKGYKWAGGFEYRRNSSGSLVVINVVEIGDYTKGVIPYEIGTNWTEEGTKVGAVCASSYVVFNKNRHSAYGFDVCNTDHCQVYQGLNRATAQSNAYCDAVAGLAMFYDGKICDTVYHSTNGGYTEDAVNVWGVDYPYLKAVPDTYEDLDRAQYGRWSYTYTGEEIAWVLNQKNYSIGTVTNAWVEKFTPAGNVYTVSFMDASGKKLSFSKEAARTILTSSTLGKGTRSQRYTISSGTVEIAAGESGTSISASTAQVIGADGKIQGLRNPGEVYVLTANGTDALRSESTSGVFVVSGTGWGHNVGLSQWGSRGRAEAGWDYVSILEYYYTGAKVMNIQEVLGR